jgi:hypothetical protein
MTVILLLTALAAIWIVTTSLRGTLRRLPELRHAAATCPATREVRFTVRELKVRWEPASATVVPFRRPVRRHPQQAGLRAAA